MSFVNTSPSRSRPFTINRGSHYQERINSDKQMESDVSLLLLLTYTTTGGNIQEVGAKLSYLTSFGD